jgi:cell division protein FtsW
VDFQAGNLRSKIKNNPDSKKKYLSIYGTQTLWFPVIALISFGLIFVYSSSGVYASEKYGNEFIFIKKQAMYLAPGLLVAWLGAKIPFGKLSHFALPFFLFMLFAVVLTKVPGIGRKVGGASRWLAIGPLGIQPSEYLKIATVIYCSKLLSDKPKELLRLWVAIPAICALLLQPDFGSTLILVLGLVGIVFLHGIPKRLFLLAAGFIVPILLLVMIAAPYRVRRLTAFLDPFADPLGAGFQVIQSFVAIASGGAFGKGLGASQQKLFFLPEAHTDFILSVIGEEMGFIGFMSLVLIFSLLFVSIIQVAITAQSSFERLFTAGFFAMMAGSCFVNMSVVAGLLPTKGLPLPFISSGGSSLLANLFMMGLISQVHKNTTLQRTKETELCSKITPESTLLA